MDKYEVCNAMKRYGGGFVQALAEAWFRADLDNRQKIEDTWPEIWTEYAELVQRAKRVRS